MKKLFLLSTSLILACSIFSQEKGSERLQNKKINKNVKSAQIKEVSPINQSVNTSSNEPVSYSIGPDGVQRVVREAKTEADFSPETIELVKNNLMELYGDYYKVYGESDIISSAEFYERCEFISLRQAPEDIPNISSLDLIDKYNYEKVHQNKNMEEFDPSAFNVFKYRIDDYAKNDLYYKIYSTGIVLKIKGSNE